MGGGNQYNSDALVYVTFEMMTFSIFVPLFSALKTELALGTSVLPKR